MVLEIQPGQDFQTQGHYGKVKSKLNHDVAHLPPPPPPPPPPHQFPYQVSTSYTLQFPRYSPGKIFKLKVTTARSNQGHTMTLHTYTHPPPPPNQFPYQV